jgi:hypothetical protein
MSDGVDMEMDAGRDMAVDSDLGQGVVLVEDDFADGMEGWTASYTDYTDAVADGINFVSELRARPDDLSSTGTAFFIGGRNVSDDLFMFFRKELGPSDGIEPNTAYEVRWSRLALASNVPSGCFGIGGSPGESVYVKAGASAEEPRRVRDADGTGYVLSVDKGNQASEGTDALNVGTIGTSVDCNEVPSPDEAPWERLEFTGTLGMPVTSNADGTLWVFMGTDSGFEGRTELFYLDLRVELVPAP